MKRKVQNVVRPLGRAISAGAIAIHIPQHNDERVPVPILSTTRQLVLRDFSDSRSRPSGGMIQTAHSRRHSIAEGGRVAVVLSPLQAELFILNMARANFDELLSGYEGFLCRRRLPRWTMDNPETLFMRCFLCGDQSGATDQDPAARARGAICLIRQTNYLLDQEIAALEKVLAKRRR